MKIEGDVEIIRFRNEENGYSVVLLDCDGERLTAVGQFPPLKEGMRLELDGEYRLHPKFGRQFSATSVTVCMPTDLDGMVRYLGSGIIKGIGPKTALSIVSKFGERTFEVIEKTPLRLAEIRGISRDKAMQIGQKFEQMKSMNDAMMFMSTHGITLGMAMRIYDFYGDQTVSVISSNPYRLIEDVDGVGFIRADAIAAKLGIEPSARSRLRAGLVYVLKDASDGAGNTYLPQDELVEKSLTLLNAGSEEDLLDIIEELAIESVIKPVKLSSCKSAVMLRKAFRAERSVATFLTRLIEGRSEIVEEVDSDIAEFERLSGIKLAPAQREAVTLAARSGVCVITGGPGTGKTTIVKCMLGIFERRKEKVMLMAPTGRAAKRLSESTGNDASTIHRALASLGDNEESEPYLPASVVIVDEVSMMDVYLTDMLLKHLRPQASIIFVGDKDQLPSVGAGNVLADMLSCGSIPTAKLSRIYRQGRESLIVENAHRINSGEMPNLRVNDSDFFFTSCEDATLAAETIVDLASRRLPKYLNCDPYKVQVLCPMKNGACGTVNLNVLLRERVNPKTSAYGEIRDENSVWRVGDKVMHVANNYQLEWKNFFCGYEEGKGVFNGDLGVITAARTDSGEIDVKFEDGREATYNSELRLQLMPAYAVTVHKSQGSEFDAVIIPVLGGGPMIMTRNLLYTAITRARKMVVIVGSEYWVRRMVGNDYVQKRYSALADFIAEAMKKNLLLESFKR